MSAPVLQTTGNIAAVTTGNLAITLPAYQADDIVIITSVGWVPNTTTGTNTQSLASPWTKYSPDVTRITGGIIDAEYAFWWARATSNSSLGTTVTITRPTSWDTGTDTCWAGVAYVIRGCTPTGNPYDSITVSSLYTAANQAFPAVTYNDGNNLVVQFYCSADNNTIGAAPTGWTAGTARTTTTGTDAGFQTYRQTLSTNTSSTSPTSTSTIALPAQGDYVFFGVSFTPNIITATVSDSGTGSQSATGSIAGTPTVSRTASDSATGSESSTENFFTIVTRTILAATAGNPGLGTEAASGKTTVFKRSVADSANSIGLPSFTTTGASSDVVSGGYRTITWTSGGTFVPSDRFLVEYLVVAGGGAGGYDNGGGGGGGGVLSGTAYPEATTHTVTIGAGGVASTTFTISPTPAQNSVLGSVATAIGGGNGGGYNGDTFVASRATTGGSGGGAGNTTSGIYLLGATGTPGQGNDGGDATTRLSSGSRAAGGGGGAGAAGGDAVAGNAGDGGAGIEWPTGSGNYYGGGGGGWFYTSGAANGLGGLGGGGSGATFTVSAVDGTPNTGGGGGGGGAASTVVGGDGGSGIVIVRIPEPAQNFKVIKRKKYYLVT